MKKKKYFKFLDIHHMEEEFPSVAPSNKIVTSSEAEFS